MLFLGDDWAEAHHDIELQDEKVVSWHDDACRKGWLA